MGSSTFALALAAGSPSTGFLDDALDAGLADGALTLEGGLEALEGGLVASDAGLTTVTETGSVVTAWDAGLEVRAFDAGLAFLLSVGATASFASPFGSSSALRFFPREDLGFSPLSAESFFVLGFWTFLGT